VKRRIVLIGFSATGKSTVGERLAQRLGWKFIDTDREIIQLTGKTIHEIFHGDGEDAFRDHERKLLRTASRRQGIVVASGGGAVLVEQLRHIMERSFFVTCLEARPHTILRRLLKDTEAGTNPMAPLLTRGPDALGRISYLKQFRQPYYAIANWTVHTDNLTPDEVVDEIMHGWTYYLKSDMAARAPARLDYPLGDARETDAPYETKVWDT
jgi:shikimate kinase